MLQEKKIKYVKKKKLKYQTIWNYMRRNPVFRISEIMMVCDVSYAYLQKFIKALEEAKYLRFTSKSKSPCTSREYRLIENTGVIAPALVPVGLYDENIKETIVLYPENEILIPEYLPQILEAIKTTTYCTKDDLCKLAKIRRTHLLKWWKIINKLGLIIDTCIDKEKNFIFCEKRAREILKEIKNGAYKEGNFELESLWIKQ